MCKASPILVLLAFVAGVHATDTGKPKTNPVVVTNVTLGEHAAKQLDHELPLPKEVLPLKSRYWIGFIYILRLNVLGVDRCYLGDEASLYIGFIKGITLGGLGVWAFFDGAVLSHVMLSGHNSLDQHGFRCQFSHGHEFWASFLFLLSIFVWLLEEHARYVHARNLEKKVSDEKDHNIVQDPNEWQVVQDHKIVQYQPLQA